MKKLLLTTLLLALGQFAIAQCTPDPIYAGEEFGFWPETTDDFAPAVVDIAYSQVINVVAPVNGGEIDPSFSIYAIDSIVIVNIMGLPPGYDFVCNQSSCGIPGGEQGCLELSGTTAVAGEYPLTIVLSIYANVSGAGLVVPYNYTEYTLTVGLVEGVDDLASSAKLLGQNVPNPVTNMTYIPYSTKEVEWITFAVHNLMGEKIYEERFLSQFGENRIEFIPETLRNGMYLYSITGNDFTQTKRMMIKR